MRAIIAFYRTHIALHFLCRNSYQSLGGENLGESPLWYDTLSKTQTWHLRFRAAALLDALALVPACAERLNSFAFFGALLLLLLATTAWAAATETVT